MDRATAASDLLLATVALGGSLVLIATPSGQRAKRALWSLALAFAAVAAGLGAASHGSALAPRVHDLLWRGLHLSLNLAVALVVSGVMADAHSPASGARAAPFLAGAAALATPSLHRLRADAPLLIAIESLVLSGAIAVYARLARRGRAGARAVAAGLLVSAAGAALAAAAAARPELNALAHLLQSAGVAAIIIGIRSSLRANPT